MTETLVWRRIRIDLASARARSVSGNAVLAGFATAVMVAAGCTTLTIREPEVGFAVEAWPPSRYFDGREIAVEQAGDLIESMLDQEGFWCRLESEAIVVHVGEDVLYLGCPNELPALPLQTAGLGVFVEDVDGSPYEIVRSELHPYKVASPTFWDELRGRLAEGSGSVLLLRQWAAGVGGEQWYLVAHEADVSAIVDASVPRSIYALFPEASFVYIDQHPTPAALAKFNSNSSLGNLRILCRSEEEPKLRAQSVSNEQELLDAWNDAPTGSLLFEWPSEDSSIEVAVAADPDGVVRTSATF